MSELEQTIEELEAEVLAELEEASKQPTDGAAPAEGKKSLGNETPGGEVDDGGEPVVKPDATKSPTDVAAKKVSKDTSAPTKGAKSEPKVKQGSSGEATPGETMKLAAGDQVEPEEGQEVVKEARMTKEMYKQEMMKKMEGMKAVDLKAAYEMMMKPEDMEMDEETIVRTQET